MNRPVAAILTFALISFANSPWLTSQEAPAPTPVPDGVTTDQIMSNQCGPMVEWTEVPMFRQSDHCFDSFISPITNLVYFEDPRALTEIRPFFMSHKVPLGAGGGNVQLYGAQIRMRLTENISLIAIKDGYATTDNALLQDGWADIAAGLKFTLFRNVEKQSILSTGFTFELPTGEANMFQGNGDGEWNLFMAGAQKITQRINWMSASGIRLPSNSSDESTSSYWSNHFDYQITKSFYVLTEFNWYHWIKSGQDGPIAGIEGLDLINFGNPGVAGNDIVTGAVGFKFKAGPHSETGVAFEFPMTQRRDIIDNRLTVDWRLRF